MTDESGRTLAEIAEGIGVTTNNVAEYKACIAGLRRALELGATDVLVRADSHLMVEQASGRYRVKNPGLQVLHRELRDLVGEFPGTVSFEHVRREFNKAADKLANKGLDEWLAARSARP